MGQKVHPYGFRLGYNKDWHSHWFAKKQFGDFLIEDLRLKRELKQRFTGAGVSQVDIERAANRLKIIIYTSRPGIIIGRKGAEIDKLKGDISSRTGREVLVSIQEIHKPELNAQLQAEKIAAQLEKRIAFRRAMRKAVEESLRFGAQGIKVKVGGRLNGAEIARSEWHLQGQLPLHTLRSDVDYGFAEAHTTFGVIGVKCWIYFFFSSRRRHTRSYGDWSSDVCSSDLSERSHALDCATGYGRGLRGVSAATGRGIGDRNADTGAVGEAGPQAGEEGIERRLGESA